VLVSPNSLSRSSCFAALTAITFEVEEGIVFEAFRSDRLVSDSAGEVLVACRPPAAFFGVEVAGSAGFTSVKRGKAKSIRSVPSLCSSTGDGIPSPSVLRSITEASGAPFTFS